MTTSLISAESALIWSVVGFMVLQPILYDGVSPFAYPREALFWAIVNGVFNGLGAWTLMAAMRHGGKASIVLPITALYPLFVTILAPMLLHETVNIRQAAGVLCATASIFLMSTESQSH